MNLDELKKLKNGIERRTVTTEIRAKEDGQAPVIEGYAALFNVLSQDLGGFKEKIRPGAFSKTLGEADVRALLNHDPNYVLGRNTRKTLTLKEDDTGLWTETNPPDTQWARDLMVSMKRGDIDQMSFGFRVIRDEWTEQPFGIQRELVELQLFDISPVTFPAYLQTSVGVRSIDLSKATPEEIQKFIEELRSKIAPKTAPAVDGHPGLSQLKRRLRLLEAEN